MIIDPYTWYKLAIHEIEHVSADTVAVRFKRPPTYRFHAGQYAVTRVATNPATQLIRQYSFSSSENDDLLEILVQLEPSGAVSGWFVETATAGDAVEISQPFGHFTLPQSYTSVLLVAGRVGIAPFASMIQSTPRTPSISLLYSVRNAEQLCYKELFEKGNASYFVTSSGARIDEKTIQPYLRPDQLVYICGSKRFVDGITEVLHTLKVPPELIRRELFTLQ